MVECNSFSLFLDWLRRPGTMYVCEGDTASFQWSHNHSADVLQELDFFKSLPSRQSLIEMKHPGIQEPVQHIDRVDLVANSSFEFTLEDAMVSDSGRYEIDTYYGDPQWLNYDEAYLEVLDKTGNHSSSISFSLLFTDV